MHNEEQQRNIFYPMKLGIDRHDIDFNSSLCNFMKKEIYHRQFNRNLHSSHPIMLRRINPLFCYSHMRERYDGVLSHLTYTCCNKSKGVIMSLKWFNDGKRLLTGTKLSELAIWNGVYFNFEDMKRIPTEGGGVTCLEWSKKDNLFAGNTLGHVVILSSALNLLDNYAYEGLKKNVQDLSLSCCNTKLAGCADTCDPIIWDVKTRKVIKTLQCKHVDTNNINCLDWNPVNNVIASGNRTQLISFWDIRMNEPIISINAHKSSVNKIKWNNEGKYLISCSKDSLIKLWDIRRFKVLHSYKNETSQKDKVALGANISSNMNSNDNNINNTLINNDNNINNFNSNENNIIKNNMNDNINVDSNNININNNTNDNIDERAGEQIKNNINDIISNDFNANNVNNLVTGANKSLTGYEPTYIAWNPIQNHIFVSGDNQGAIKFYSTNSNKCIQTIHSAHEEIDKTTAVTLLDWNPLGHILTSFGDDKLLKFWSATSCGSFISNEINANVFASIDKTGAFPSSKYMHEEMNLDNISSDQSIYDSDENGYIKSTINNNYYKKYSQRSKKKKKIINKKLSTPPNFLEFEVHNINDKIDIYEIDDTNDIKKQHIYNVDTI